MALEPHWRVLEDATFTVLGQKLPPNNPMRETIAFYLHAAGIEAGYGYFAPNVPYSYKLVFELTYPNGTTEYELPRRRTPRLVCACQLCSISLPPTNTSRYDS